VQKTETTGPISPYAVQIYCPTCDSANEPGNGRFFDIPDFRLYCAAEKDWQGVKESALSNYWPRSELSKGWKTHGWAIPDHGYTHYWKMFNGRQLYVHASLLRSIDQHSTSSAARELVLSAFTHFLRCNCIFTIWHLRNSQISAFLSNNSYQAKNTVVETAPFAPVGDGSWRSGVRGVLSGIGWKSTPWEIVPNTRLEAVLTTELSQQLSGKTTKVQTGDSVIDSTLVCGSATALAVQDGTFDLVITDPPFGEIMQYAELSDFFYVWIRLVLKAPYPELFSPEYTPKALEVVTNPFRNEDPNVFYQRLLTNCWREALRAMKPGGVLAFTFHHEKDGPWISVLESLFEAGAYLEGAYPVRSDASKGEEKVAFGAEKVEYDIIHVCRKRLDAPEPISWARLRKQIMQDVRQLREIIEQHQKEGLGEADLQVIRRGKALEYYSRHYGKVYIEKGRESEFTVKDALLGINQLLDDERDTSSEAPPVTAEPYTRQFLRLFADKSTLDRDQMQKYLRGTGVSPSEFLERGWCSEEKKVFSVTPPLEWAQQWKGKARKAMSRDFDQSYFLIGACYDESGIKVSDTLDSGGFAPHPAIPDLLDWFGMHGSDTDMKAAARRAKQIYSAWLAKNTKEIMVQHTLFDLENE
jgi:adenine-specific DNA methylase